MSRYRERVKGDPLQKKLSEILSYNADAPRTSGAWNSFIEEDVIALQNLTASYYEIARTNNMPVKAVLEQAEEDVKVKDSHLVHNAVMTFVNTHPESRKRNLRVPPLIHRAPNKVVPKRPGTIQGTIPITPGPQVPAKKTSPEDDLLYWRDDPNLNEHHEHWHNLYGNAQMQDTDGSTFWKKRQGELFIYMHRQMVARYEAERLSNGLPEVKAYSDYTEVIQEHYYPDDDLSAMRSGSVVTFSARESGGVLKDGLSSTGQDGSVREGTKVTDLANNRDLLVRTIEQGYFEDVSGSKSIKTADNLDLLAVAIEMGITQRTYQNYSADVWGSKYPSFHNDGHILISQIGITDPSQPWGVMSNNAVASRDPMFYRWHTYVDNLFTKFQHKLGPNHFRPDDVPVRIPHNGIFFVFKDKIANATPANIATVASQFATTIKDKDPHNATNILETKMKIRDYEWREGGEDDGEITDISKIEYLFPREWYYFFRVENPTSQDVNVTFRVFMVPEAFKNNHARYIELDKFQQVIPAKKTTVIARDCDKSSVVAQPPKKTADDLDDVADVPDADYSEFCECGWPFHLVLPRGTGEGLPCKLVVFISPGTDKVDAVKKCGSLSFCGAEDPKGDYPDTREMGYPFNRPFKNGSCDEAFSGLKYVATKDFKIKLVGDFPEFTK